MKVKRYSNIELLRIILMIMIISLHYMNGGMGGALKESTGVNYYMVRFVESLFIMAVNGFIIITGYCSINKQMININKIVKLFLELIIYNVIIQIILVLIGQIQFTIKDFIKNFIPIWHNSYWFFKIYIVLYLLIPFINCGLNSMDKYRYRKLIIILIFTFSIWDSFVPVKIIGGNGYSITNFILLYCIGGYLRLHYQNKKEAKVWFFRNLIFGSLTFICLFVPIIKEGSWNYYFIFNILSAVCLFNAFDKITIESNFVNLIASSVFGVFILHLSPYLLNLQYKIARTDLFWNSKFILIHMVMTSIAIFLLFTIIDILRKKIFSMFKFKFINNIKMLNIEI